MAARPDAAADWAHALENLALPERIIADAPDDPHGFPVERFERSARDALERGRSTPSDRAALEELDEGGSVLDVGCGAGAASLPLAARAGALIGVDEHPGMLDVYERVARDVGIPVATHAGRWPDIAAEVAEADVVVCHHVLYNVQDLERFAEAMTDHARPFVVVELTVEHPLSWMRPYWRDLHEWDRPPGPTVDDAVAVLEELGLEVSRERWQRSFGAEVPEERFASLRRRLCLTEDRDDELRAAVDRHGIPDERDVETLRWEGRGTAQPTGAGPGSAP